MNTTLPPHDIHRLLHAEHDDPFGVLGLHQTDNIWVLRSFRPDAKELTIVDRHHVERRFPAIRIAEEGLFESSIGGRIRGPGISGRAHHLVGRDLPDQRPLLLWTNFR